MDIERDAHILAIGETLIDIVSPAGRPQDATEIPGGSPANVAMTLGRLGRPVALQTWYGHDARGRVVEEHFGASRVTITPESSGADRTMTALALLDENGAATYTFDFDWAPPAPIRVSPAAQIVEAGSISAAQLPGALDILAALERARDHALIAYDPNARPSIMGSPQEALSLVERFVAVSDLVKVSDEDIAWLTGGHDLDTTIERWLALGPSLVVVTRGKEGGLGVTRSGVRLAHAPKKVEVVDTVGAGDSFMGGLLDAMWGLGLRGAQAREALASIDEETVARILARASSVSDVTVSRAGANPPWADELDELDA
ncbi:carbohydrate kinase [Actinomyces sp. B33]|uniref:carbohydrate kinase family protein n=1 Tax=Actinomyces sp. B33 TaxID=2942131 RepID=UPI00234000D7|nr:carbohydrate kinase [Actinomyces sp. B33]MDC4232604.1 carbohydrate kinase [Actinomyces sp. B33]